MLRVTVVVQRIMKMPLLFRMQCYIFWDLYILSKCLELDLDTFRFREHVPSLDEIL